MSWNPGSPLIFLSHPPNATFLSLWRRQLLAWFHQSRAGPTKTSSCILNFSEIDRADSFFAFQSPKFSVTQHKSLAGFVASSPFLCVAHLRVQLWAPHCPPSPRRSPPDTCTLEPPRGADCGATTGGFERPRPAPSQYLPRCGATVVKLRPSRTQQLGVPRGF